MKTLQRALVGIVIVISIINISVATGHEKHSSGNGNSQRNQEIQSENNKLNSVTSKITTV